MKFSTTSFLFFALFSAIFILAGPVLVFAQGGTNFIEIENPLEADTIEEILCAITNLLKTFGLGIGIVMVIWGGIQILAAGGSEEKATQGKKTITWAVIGYAIIFAVDFIVGFVIEILGGTVPPMCQ